MNFFRKNWLLILNEDKWKEYTNKCEKRHSIFNKGLSAGAEPQMYPCLVYSYHDVVSNQWINIFVYEDEAMELLHSKFEKLTSALKVYGAPKNWAGRLWNGPNEYPPELADTAIRETK
jgi:hypothetical protein